MTNSSTAPSPHQEQGNPWRESLEQRLRERMRELIAQVLEEEVEDAGRSRGRRRAASAVLDAGRKRAGMAEPTVASLPALDAGSRAGGAGRVSVGREHAAHSRGALSAAGSGAAVEERGEPPGGAAGGRLPGLAEARPGRRTDRVSLPGCDLPEGAQRGKSGFAARAGGAGGARRRGGGAAGAGHGRAGARTVPGPLAQAVPGGGGESGRSGRRAADVLRVPGQSVAFAAHHQRDRAAAVGVPAPGENARPAAE